VPVPPKPPAKVAVSAPAPVAPALVAPTPPSPISPSGSFKGYSFLNYLTRNKSGIKIIFGGVVAYAAAAPQVFANPALNTLFAIVVGGLAKMGLDAVDYYLTAVPIEQK
jgi:hypothetical protein